MALPRRGALPPAEYEAGLSASDTHFVWLWEVLTEGRVGDRVAFLRFAAARSRLPSSAAFLAKPFTFTRPKGGAETAPDSYFPTAQTCFFNLSIPRYSSKEVLRGS
jgi:hypothetical protein